MLASQAGADEGPGGPINMPTATTLTPTFHQSLAQVKKVVRPIAKLGRNAPQVFTVRSIAPHRGAS